jgi:hypothetical protein
VHQTVSGPHLLRTISFALPEAHHWKFCIYVRRFYPELRSAVELSLQSKHMENGEIFPARRHRKVAYQNRLLPSALFRQYQSHRERKHRAFFASSIKISVDVIFTLLLPNASTFALEGLKNIFCCCDALRGGESIPFHRFGVIQCHTSTRSV